MGQPSRPRTHPGHTGPHHPSSHHPATRHHTTANRGNTPAASPPTLAASPHPAPPPRPTGAHHENAPHTSQPAGHAHAPHAGSHTAQADHATHMTPPRRSANASPHAAQTQTHETTWTDEGSDTSPGHRRAAPRRHHRQPSSGNYPDPHPTRADHPSPAETTT